MGVSAAPGARIKSIQRAVVTISSAATANATISAVDPTKSQLRLLGYTPGPSGAYVQQGNVPRLWFTNSTTVSAVRIGTTTDTTDCTIEVTEWY